MDARRGRPSHQLERAHGGVARSQESLPAQTPCNRTPRDRQLHDGGISEPPSRDSFLPALPPRNTGVGVGSSPGSVSGGSTCTRHPQLHSRLFFQACDRQRRLDPAGRNIPQSSPDICSPEHRPVRGSPQSSPSPIHQLAARPRGRGGRRLQCSPVVDGWVCVSSLHTGQQVSPASSPLSNSPSNSGGASMEVPGILPAASGNISPDTSLATIVGGCRSMGPDPSRSTISTLSRLDYLRSTIRHRGLSDHAARLWEASWRSQSNASYQSA